MPSGKARLAAPEAITPPVVWRKALRRERRPAYHWNGRRADRVFPYQQAVWAELPEQRPA